MVYDKKIRDRVEELLKNEKKCRQNNMWLTIRVFQEIAKENGENFYIPYSLIKKFPTFESVAACKRKIMHKEGRFNIDFVPEEGVTYEKPEVLNNA